MKKLTLVLCLVLLAGCARLDAEPNCNGGTSRFRWTLTNTTSDQVLTVDDVELVPNGAGTSGPHSFVGNSVSAGSSMTHLDYATPNASETLTVTYHLSGSPGTAREVTQTQTEVCP